MLHSICRYAVAVSLRGVSMAQGPFVSFSLLQLKLKDDMLIFFFLFSEMELDISFEC